MKTIKLTSLLLILSLFFSCNRDDIKDIFKDGSTSEHSKSSTTNPDDSAVAHDSVVGGVILIDYSATRSTNTTITIAFNDATSATKTTADTLGTYTPQSVSYTWAKASDTTATLIIVDSSSTTEYLLSFTSANVGNVSQTNGSAVEIPSFVFTTIPQ